MIDKDLRVIAKSSRFAISKVNRIFNQKLTRFIFLRIENMFNSNFFSCRDPFVKVTSMNRPRRKNILSVLREIPSW